MTGLIACEELERYDDRLTVEVRSVQQRRELIEAIVTQSAHV